MKKIKNLIGIVICLLFITSVGYSQESVSKKPDKSSILIGNGPENAMLVDCNINAGGDQIYCNTTLVIPLNGTPGGVTSSTIQWSVISNPIGIIPTILSPTSLTTTFTRTPSMGFGVFLFEISGTCPATGNVERDTVEISILGPVVPAVILDVALAPVGDTVVVCTSVELAGSIPGPGEVGVWSSTSGQTIPPTTGGNLLQTVSVSSNCIYRTYYYTISNGFEQGCKSIDTVVVKFERGATPSIADRAICGTTYNYCGSHIGCEGTTSFTIIPPTGVAVPSFTTNNNGRCANITFTVSGTYQVIYNVTSNGTCPSGIDTGTIEVCLATIPANPFGANFLDRYCGPFPEDTVWLSANVSNSQFTYTQWLPVNAAVGAAVTIVTTSPGQAYALINDPSIDYHGFYIRATFIDNTGCSFANGSGCSKTYTQYTQYQRGTSFPAESDTLRIYCQAPGQTFRPRDYIDIDGTLVNYSVDAIQVPPGSAISLTGSYNASSPLDFSAAGVYIFQNIIGTFGDTSCPDTIQWVVNVATLQNPSAGSNSQIKICDNDTVPLVGNAALDFNGNPDPFALKQWTQIDGHPPVTFLGSANSQVVDVTGFTVVGTYMFEYSFSKDSNCYLADTMIVIVDSCDSCPEFYIYTCCDLNGGVASKSSSSSRRPVITPLVQSKITAYNKAVKKRYPIKSLTVDSCCMYCEFPDVPFPIFVYGEDGNLVDTYVYTVTWSHHGPPYYASDSIFPDSLTIVTVSGPDSCFWSDTFLLPCCDDLSPQGVCCDTFDLDLNIDSICATDPCDTNLLNYPLYVTLSGSSSPLGYNGYFFTWSNGQHANQISIPRGTQHYWVAIYDSTAGCTDTAFYDIDCITIPICVPVTPIKFGCTVSKTGIQTLNWNTTAGLTYEVQIIYNDPFCVPGGTGSSPVSFFVAGGSYTVNVSPITGCLSWRVRSICPDGTTSPWSSKQCCCKPINPCFPVTPIKLGCNISKTGIQTLTWATTPGFTYQVQIIYNDPFCVKGGTGSNPVTFNVSGGSYTVNVSPITGCLSWRVRSICPSGARSLWSSKQCCCKPIISFCRPTVPANLKCISSTFGQTLAWDNILGRTYEVEIIYGTYDPLYKCCKPPMLSPLPTIIASNTNSIFMNTSKCFTWRVRSICKDGTRSEWSGRKCSCSKSIIIKDPTKGQTRISVNPNGGISNEQDITILVAPNPVTDITVFDIKTVGNDKDLGILYISKLTGEQVYNSQVKLNGKSVIDLSELSSGTYIYKVMSDGTYKSGRIVIAN